MLRDFLVDIRSAARSLRREPGVVLMAVLALAVGVGSAATVFGMANQLLLRPVPGVADPDRAAYLALPITEIPGIDDFSGLNTQDFDELRLKADLLTGIASWSFAGVRHLSAPDGRIVEVVSGSIYGDFFEALGVRPRQGRLLRADETGPDVDPRVAVIGEALAERLFGDAGDVAGRTIQVDGESITVLGVAGDGFQGPERRLGVEMWLPLSSLMVFNGFHRETLAQSALHHSLVTRLRRGVDVASAEAQVTRVLRDLAAGEASDDRILRMTPQLLLGLRLPRAARARTEAALALFAGIVGVVLLIACANVATLLLVRNVTQRPTIATRRALGASSGRIARYQLAESTLIAGTGTAAGLGAAWLIALLLQGQRLTAGMPAFRPFTVDWRVLAFGIVAAIITLLLSGIVPAALAGRFDLADALRGAGGPDKERMASVRRFLSAGQVAVCVTLLVATGLLTRTVHNLYAADTGLSIEGVWALDLGTLTDSGLESDLDAASAAIVASAQQVPGIEHVAVARSAVNFRTQGQVALPEAPEGATVTAVAAVSPGWFEVFRVEMLNGRPFREGEWERGAFVPVVVTPPLARRLFGTVDASGRAIRVAVGDWMEGQIVGVTKDLQDPQALGRPIEAAFVPMGSTPLPGLTLIVRTGHMTSDAVGGLRASVESGMPGRFVSDPVSVRSIYGTAFSEQRLFGRLLGLLSALAISLASVGLYSVIAFSVAQRTREFGIRLALGAGAPRIARLVLGDAAAIVGLGTGVGLVGASVLSILLETRLYGVTPLDPISYGAAVGLFAIVAAFASWIPTLRAVRSDPIEAFRDG